MHPKSEQPVAPDKTSRQENIKPTEGDNRTRTLLEAIPDFMFLFNRAGQFIDFKAPGGAMLLMSPEQFLNKYPRDVLPPDLADLTSEKIRAVFETGAAQHGVVISRITGEVDFANPALAMMLGYQVEELINKHWNTMVPEDQPEIIARADQRRQMGATYRYETKLLHKNGSTVPVQVSGRPIYDRESGAIKQTLAVMKNIAGIKETERLLADKNATLQLLNTYATEQSATMDYSSLQDLILEQVTKYTGALMTAFSEFQADRQILIIRKVKTEKRWLNMAVRLIGGEILGFETPIDKAGYREITADVVTSYDSLTDITGGAVPEMISVVKVLL